MTNTAAIAIALAFVIHNVTLLHDFKIITESNTESKLVFISSVCLLLRKINWFPSIFCAKLWLIYFVLEILLSIITIESFLIYIWKPAEEYIFLHADDILEYIYEETECEWLVCSLCCGRNDCTDIFARLLLKVMSFACLLSVCLIARIK